MNIGVRDLQTLDVHQVRIADRPIEQKHINHGPQNSWFVPRDHLEDQKDSLPAIRNSGRMGDKHLVSASAELPPLTTNNHGRSHILHRDYLSQS